MGDRIKRIIAALIDYYIALIPALIPAFIGARRMESGKGGYLIIILAFLLAFGGLALFILRDAVFGGRSIGKRIFGLYVVDEQTLQPVRGGKPALKNVFNLINVMWFVDALLNSGLSMSKPTGPIMCSVTPAATQVRIMLPVF